MHTISRFHMHFDLSSFLYPLLTLLFPICVFVRSKLKNLEKGMKQDLAAPLFDKLIFNKVRIHYAAHDQLSAYL